MALALPNLPSNEVTRYHQDSWQLIVMSYYITFPVSKVAGSSQNTLTNTLALEQYYRTRIITITPSGLGSVYAAHGKGLVAMGRDER